MSKRKIYKLLVKIQVWWIQDLCTKISSVPVEKQNQVETKKFKKKKMFTPATKTIKYVRKRN